MKTDELIELLQQRIYEIAVNNDPGKHTAAPIEWSEEATTELASYIVKCMEWARREGMFTEEKIGEPVTALSLGFPSPTVFGPTIKRTIRPLSLPPEDWKP